MQNTNSIGFSLTVLIVVLFVSFLFPSGPVSASSESGVTMCSSADTIVRGQPVNISVSSYGSSCSGTTSGTYYPANTTTYETVCTRGDGIGGTYYTTACVTVNVQVPGICGTANGTTSTAVPTSGLCSQGSASAVSGSGAYWYWTCYGSNGGANASCSAHRPFLEICEQTPDGWFSRTDGSSLTTIAQGETTTLQAFYDTNPGDCAGTVAPASGTSWTETSDPSNAFTVSPGSVAVSMTATGNISTGRMSVSRPDGYSSVNLWIPGYCGWAVRCDNTSDQHCTDEQYWITDPVCGSKNCPAGGTRECEYNWREVAPSL